MSACTFIREGGGALLLFVSCQLSSPSIFVLVFTNGMCARSDLPDRRRTKRMTVGKSDGPRVKRGGIEVTVNNKPPSREILASLD